MVPTTAQIRTYMQESVSDYVDDCAEVNATGLAEDACQHFNGYEGDDIPDEYFDLAAEIALDYEHNSND